MATRSPSCLPSAAAELLSSAPLGLDPLVSEVAGPGLGAVVTMLGTVRGEEDGRPIRSITYEAYAPMAEKVMRSIVARAESRWGVRAAVRHRVSSVPVGEAAVAVAAAGVHRPEAFEACRFLIDQIKTGAPIWKTGFEEAA